MQRLTAILTPSRAEKDIIDGKLLTGPSLNEKLLKEYSILATFFKFVKFHFSG